MKGHGKNRPDSPAGSDLENKKRLVYIGSRVDRGYRDKPNKEKLTNRHGVAYRYNQPHAVVHYIELLKRLQCHVSK